MKRYILSLLFLASTPVYPVSYDSGNFGLSSVDNITVSTINAVHVGNTIGSVTASTVTVSSRFGLPSNAAPRTNVTPSAAGQLIFNTTQSEICVSSGTVVTSWVKAASTTTACGN